MPARGPPPRPLSPRLKGLGRPGAPTLSHSPCPPGRARKEALSPRSRALLPRGLPPRPSNPSWLRAGTPRAAPSSRRHLPTPLCVVPGFSNLFSMTRLSISETAALGAVSRSGEAEEGTLFYRNRGRLEPITEAGAETFITGPAPPPPPPHTHTGKTRRASGQPSGF